MIPGNTASQGKYVDPPTSVTASAGDAQATISFTLPVYDGKQVATYVATSSPSGITGSGASSPITVSGLSNGTAYTFTVTTISGYGVSATSVASNSVTPVAPTTTAAPPPPTTTTVTCNGSCPDPTAQGYTFTGNKTVSGDPLGACPGCSTTSYNEYQKAGCASLACFTGCGGCPTTTTTTTTTTPPCPNGAPCTACGEAAGVPGQCTDAFGGCVCFYWGGL